MLEWWAEQNLYQRHLWPGIYSSRLRSSENSWPPEEITGQLYVARGHPAVSGAVHFSMRTFLENSQGINHRAAEGPRSEERRVGKESKSRQSCYRWRKTKRRSNDSDESCTNWRSTRGSALCSRYGWI